VLAIFPAEQTPTHHLLLQPRRSPSRQGWGRSYKVSRPCFSQRASREFVCTHVASGQVDSVRVSGGRTSCDAVHSEERGGEACLFVCVCVWGGGAFFVQHHFDCHRSVISLAQGRVRIVERQELGVHASPTSPLSNLLAPFYATDTLTTRAILWWRRSRATAMDSTPSSLLSTSSSTRMSLPLQFSRTSLLEGTRSCT
jgi:hypothetical protein